MTVHNHPPYRPVCNERRVNGQLRGACLTDEGDPVSDTKPDLDAIEARTKTAHDEVSRLCCGNDRGWRMSIPADDARDSDLIISAALNDVEALVAYARTLEAELRNCRSIERIEMGTARAEAAEAERDQLRDTLALRSAAHDRLAQRLDQVRALADEFDAAHELAGHKKPDGSHWPGRSIDTRIAAERLRRVLDGEFGALVGGDQQTKDTP